MGSSMVKSALPRVLLMWVIAWQEVQVTPACAVGWRTSSKFGSSNAPLKKGTTSWQPAHQRAAFTFPSRLSDTWRVSRTLNRYGGLLNELKWCALWNHPWYA